MSPNTAERTTTPPSAAAQARSAAASADKVLSRLRQDHKALLACVELLESQLTENGDPSLAGKLIDRLIDSPDDFHHITERRLFRRLWLRLGVFLPRYIDLDELHEKRRSRRAAVVGFLDDADSAVFFADAAAREALKSFCDCVREQIAVEEQRLFPLLERRLTQEDWALVEDEIEAYNAAWSSLLATKKKAIAI